MSRGEKARLAKKPTQENQRRRPNGGSIRLEVIDSEVSAYSLGRLLRMPSDE